MAKKFIKKIAKQLFRLTTLGISKGPHITRYYFYNHLSSNFKEVIPTNFKVLSISHSECLARILGASEDQIIDASYPEFNILNLPFQDCMFDAVVSDQVLEHVEGSPQAAIDETFRVLKPGGLVLHSTCFINPIHGAPKDFWRFTPDALVHLVSRQGKILDVGGWGNVFVWLFFAFGLRYEPIPNSQWHPAHWIATSNHPRLPVTTWVLAKKIELPIKE